MDEFEDEEQEENNLSELLQNLLEAFNTFDDALRQSDRQQWESWKAGGKMVSNEFVSMYPTAEECVESITSEEEEEEEEDDV